MDSQPPSEFSELQRPLDHFRAKTKRLRIHPKEVFVLGVVSTHLAFLPWALGGMRPWGQFISLGLAVLGLIAALLPRDYTVEHTGSNSFRLVTWPRLMKFPIFWIGLALLILITIQALNPSWRYETNGKIWWMRRAAHITWLPESVDVPFARWGPWRMLMIYATALMTVCTIWVGFTRRRTLQIFFLVLASNGLALACVGIAQRLFPSRLMYWVFEPFNGSTFFTGFVYKNHAGAYLLLTLSITCGLCGWYYLRGQRRLEKSNPAGLFAFFATVIAVALVVSYARGATLTMFVFLAVCVGAFVIHQVFFNQSGRKPVVLAVLLIVFALFLKMGMGALNSGLAWDRIQEGLANGGDESFRLRLVVTRASLEMLGEKWKLGVGSGGYGYVFPNYQQHYPEIYKFPDGTPQYWWHAHNDWVEFPIELGLPGVLLMLAAGAFWTVALVRRFFWENTLSLVLVFGACLLVGYSYWDFPFQNPAILILWCALWPAATIWVTLEDQRA